MEAAEKEIAPGPVMPETPECERMKKVQSQSQAIGDFLDWLQTEEDVTFATYGYREDGRKRKRNPNTLYPHHVNIEKTLAKFFDIDLDKVETEKRAILDALHEYHQEIDAEKREGR